MSMVLIILQQMIIMLILALVGYLMFRSGKITLEGSKTIGNILIYLSLPCVIINGFLEERTPEKLIGLAVSALIAAILLLMSVAVSRLVLGRNVIENFAGSFSNPGFFGIPIIVASLSDGAVFYIAAFIAFLNMGQWTYGVWLLKNSDDAGNLLPKEERARRKAQAPKEKGGVANFFKKLVKAPFMVAITVGLFFFLSGIEMPIIAAKCITFIANMNTPLAMFTVGIYMAQVNIGKMFATGRLYLVSLVRMIIVPAITIAILCVVPNTMLEMKMALLIAAACPVGSNVAVYAQLHDGDYTYAVETVVISTILSLIAMPLAVSVANMLWL